MPSFTPLTPAVCLLSSCVSLPLAFRCLRDADCGQQACSWSQKEKDAQGVRRGGKESEQNELRKTGLTGLDVLQGFYLCINLCCKVCISLRLFDIIGLGLFHLGLVTIFSQCILLCHSLVLARKYGRRFAGMYLHPR